MPLVRSQQMHVLLNPRAWILRLVAAVLLCVASALGVAGRDGAPVSATLEGQATLLLLRAPTSYQRYFPVESTIPAVIGTPRLLVDSRAGLGLMAQCPIVLIGRAEDSTRLLRPGDALARLDWRLPLSGGPQIVLGAGRNFGGSQDPLGGSGFSADIFHAGVAIPLDRAHRIAFDADFEDRDNGGDALSVRALYLRRGRLRAVEHGIGLVFTQYTGTRRSWEDNSVSLVFQTALSRPDTGARKQLQTYALGHMDEGLTIGSAEDFFWQQPLFGDGADVAWRDRRLGLASWGVVAGTVHDASTGAPLSGATVTVRQDGLFARTGRTVATTDRLGHYECHARIGRVSSSFVFAGLLSGVAQTLLNAPVSALTGPMIKDTNRIDITEAAVRVTRDGYQPYEGIVRCARLNAWDFAVLLEPILLAPADSPQESTAADGWCAPLTIREVALETPILHPRESTTISVRVQTPSGLARHVTLTPQLEYDARRRQPCRQGAWRLKGLVPTRREGDETIYTGRLTVPRKATAGTYYLQVTASDATDPQGRSSAEHIVQLQVVRDESQRALAQRRLAAFQAEQADDTDAALAHLRQVCAGDAAAEADLRWLARLAKTAGAADDETDAWARIVASIDPEEKSARCRAIAARGDALLRAGNIAKASEVVESAVADRQKEELERWEADDVPESERISDIPMPLLVALGKVYLARGEISRADVVNEQLLTRWDAGDDPATQTFRRDLRRARALAGMRAADAGPDAWAAYGRYLMDEGRDAEAVIALRRALALREDQPAVRRDLAAVLARMASPADPPGEASDAEIAAAEAKVGLAGGTSLSRDFAAWHQCGLLLYRKACHLERTGDPGAAAAFARARTVLAEALRYGRAGADSVASSRFSVAMYSSEARAIAGFANAEARCDYQILKSLEAVERQPDDYLSWQVLAEALLDLRVPDAAADAVAHCHRLAPAHTPTIYLQARLARLQRQPDEAIRLLRQVLAANPHHPYANLELAQLAAERGDTITAAAYLAAQAREYGGIRSTQP